MLLKDNGLNAGDAARGTIGERLKYSDMMKILTLESTCDETAAAVVTDDTGARLGGGIAGRPIAALRRGAGSTARASERIVRSLMRRCQGQREIEES
jgi:hypothetical protein